VRYLIGYPPKHDFLDTDKLHSHGDREQKRLAAWPGPRQAGPGVVGRGTPDVKVMEAFRKMLLKAHQDKSGSVSDAQKHPDARAIISLNL